MMPQSSQRGLLEEVLVAADDLAVKHVSRLS